MPDQQFLIVLRGYAMDEVDALVRTVNRALASGDPAVRDAAANALRNTALRTTFRGYDRAQVDAWRETTAARL
jgi:DivIVA domain-containing protein